jgi:hypothetical protein
MDKTKASPICAEQAFIAAQQLKHRQAPSVSFHCHRRRHHASIMNTAPVLLARRWPLEQQQQHSMVKLEHPYRSYDSFDSSSSLSGPFESLSAPWPHVAIPVKEDYTNNPYSYPYPYTQHQHQHYPYFDQQVLDQAPGALQWAVSMVTSPPPSPTPSAYSSPPLSGGGAASSSSPSSWSPMSHSPLSSPELQLASPQRHLVYYFTTLPEKGKPIWVVFYDRSDHPLDAFSLRLFADTPSSSSSSSSTSSSVVLTHTLEVDKEISWRACNNEGSLDVGLTQYKVAFTCPNDTFQRAIFRAQLVNTRSGLDIDVGVMSIVSTTNQRSESFLSKLERRAPTDAHRRLVANFKRHPHKMRHFINGKGRSKGAKQASRRGHRFLMEEYVWAVEL